MYARGCNSDRARVMAECTMRPDATRTARAADDWAFADWAARQAVEHDTNYAREPLRAGARCEPCIQFVMSQAVRLTVCLRETSSQSA